MLSVCKSDAESLCFLRQVIALAQLTTLPALRGVAPLWKDSTDVDVKGFLFQNEVSIP